MPAAQPYALSYLVRGITSSKADRLALGEELSSCLEFADAVNVLPVIDGVQVDIEVTDIAPFREESFEPYVCEHVLKPAIAARGVPTASSTKTAEPRLIKKTLL